MKAVILAAGKGIRMKPLTDNLPKPLIEVKGKTILERQLTELKKAGITECIIVTGYLGNRIKEKIGKEFNGMKISYAEQEEQKGTAHALNCVKKLVSGEFIQINADLLFDYSLIKELMQKKGNAVVLRKEINAGKFGVAEVKGEILEKIN